MIYYATYFLLDITFATTFWITKKTINGISYIIYKPSKKNIKKNLDNDFVIITKNLETISETKLNNQNNFNILFDKLDKQENQINILNNHILQLKNKLTY